MAIQFILGRSGTGKTTHCIKSIVNALLEGGAEPLLLLVPEQATYQAERAILADNAIAGYHRCHVLSFDRLQFLLLGRNTARPALSWVGRQMMIHNILRENRDRLTVFGLSATAAGLSRRMAETIREMHQYAKTPEQLSRLIGELQTPMYMGTSNELSALKYTDIALVLDEYIKSIQGRFTDPDSQVEQMCRAAADTELVKGARLWVDGFAGFNAAELAILAELLKTAAETHIAFCLDPARIDVSRPRCTSPTDDLSLFGPTEQTYAALVEIVRRHRLEMRPPLILDRPRRFAHPELKHLEQHIFTDRPPPMYVGAPDNIRIVATANPRAEVNFVARQILELVKEENYRYRDIAVIASDIEGYQHYVKAYFDDYGIPLFIDRRKPLNQHPVVQLILSALQVVLGDFAGSEIYSYLKTDLVPVERDEVDALESYCVAFGISGKDWQSDDNWSFAGESDEDFDDRQIDDIRRNLTIPLLRLKDALRPKSGEVLITASQFTQFIWDFLDNLQVRRTLAEWIEQANHAGDYATADQHRQFYDRLVDVFDEMVEVFGEQKMTPSEYLAILTSAFSQLALAFIPPTLDQVLVGSVERSRHPDLKAVFLVGATQSRFPVPITSDGVLSEQDRDAAESADFELAAGPRRKLIERRYLAYIAFTRASERLFVTYPLMDDQASPQCRSQFITDIEALFEGSTEQVVAKDDIALAEIHCRSELEDALCSRLGKDRAGQATIAAHDRLDVLLSGLCEDENLGGLGSRIEAAVGYGNSAALSADVAKQLQARHLRTSATGLSTFAACPYQHFARYVLGLRQRREFRFEPLDVGLFYHRMLDRLFKRLLRDKIDLTGTTNERLLELLGREVEQFVRTDAFTGNFARHSRNNLFVIHSAVELLERAVVAFAEMLRAGRFRPSATEVAFGQPKNTTDTLGEYRINLKDGRVLSLDGKIDRLDAAQSEGNKVAIILDYKRSGQSFNWSQFYHGLDLQLPLYMLAVRHAAALDAEPVGAFYLPVEARPTKSTIDELPPPDEGFKHKARGIFNGEYAYLLDAAAGSRWNRFFNFCITQKDSQYGDYGRSGALRPDDFEKVLNFTQDRIVELAERILSGEIGVMPYQLGEDSPCSMCKYKPVCRFDWQINDYNVLEPVGKVVVLEGTG